MKVICFISMMIRMNRVMVICDGRNFVRFVKMGEGCLLFDSVIDLFSGVSFMMLELRMELL